MKLPAAIHDIAGRAGLGALFVAFAVSPCNAQETNSVVTEKSTPAATSESAREEAPAKDATSKEQITPAAAAPATTGNTNTVAAAKSTNGPVLLTYESFKIIGERNIFDQSREPRSSRSGRSSRGRNEETKRTPRIESFALVGTISYAKGTFAFFDGTSSQYRKTLKVGDSIGAYQVKDVAQNQVKLASEKQELELEVGQQLRREDEGEWQVSARFGDFASSASTSASSPSNGGDLSSSSSTNAPAASSSDSGGTSDLLKRLMQQREKELNK